MGAGYTDAAIEARLSSIAIDLNSDLGEGFGAWSMGDDESLLSVVTSANVACGYHAGDATIMRRTCENAVKNGVRIGAHVSYRDLAGFGRRTIDVAAGELISDIIYQIGALAACAQVAGGTVSYVKPHGALYNRIVWDQDQAAAVVQAVRLYDPGLAVLGLPGSQFLGLAQQAGLQAVPEGFVDRAYDDEGRLVSRRQPGSVIHDAARVTAQAVRLATDGSVISVTGSTVRPAPRSLCLHGDTPGAAELARQVRASLRQAGVRLRAFV
jgi:5-oxoprolinase (ATP-hydrolysing) subunit A